MSFPFYIRIGSLRIHPHLLFEVLAYFSAFLIFLALRNREHDPFSNDLRGWIVTAAVVGGALGCHLLGWLESPRAVSSGKTIVGGLIGGLIAVELAKKRFGVKTATGDLFALPLAVGIAIGRIGCFLTGLADQTYGKATTLPWGADFGDGVRRHPAQLYEIVFLLAVAVVLLRYSHRVHQQGDVFKFFMISYMSWRFLIDFLKPGATVFGVSLIQIACLLALIYYSPHLVRITKTFAMRSVVTEG